MVLLRLRYLARQGLFINSNIYHIYICIYNIYIISLHLLLFADTIVVLPRLRYLARQDLVCLAKSRLLLSGWRPTLHLALVLALATHNFLLARQTRQFSFTK